MLGWTAQVNDRIEKLEATVKQLLAANNFEARYYLALAVRMSKEEIAELEPEIKAQTRVYIDAVCSIGMTPEQYLAA